MAQLAAAPFIHRDSTSLETRPPWPAGTDVIAATKKAAARLLEFRGFLDDELDSIWAAQYDYFAGAT